MLSRLFTSAALVSSATLALLLIVASAVHAAPPAKTTEEIILKARSLGESGKQIEAAAFLKEEIAVRKAVKMKEPKNAENLFQLTELQLEFQHDDEALANLQEAMRLDPKQAKYHAMYARIMVFKRRIEEAIIAYKQAEELDGKNPSHPFNWGTLLMVNGLFADAATGFEAALKADPNHANANLSLANCYSQLGKYEEAVPLAVKGHELSPKDNFSAEALLAEVLHRTGKLDEAIPHYEAAHAIRPDNEAVLSGLVQIYQEQGKQEERDANIQKIYELLKAKKFNPPHYCRDRFFVGDEFVEAFEIFDPKGETGLVYRFHVMPAPGKPVKYVIALNSLDASAKPSSEGGSKKGERTYQLNRYSRKLLKAYQESFTNFGSEKPSYEKTKEIVEQIMAGKVEPTSESVPAPSPYETREPKKEKKVTIPSKGKPLK